MSKRFKHPNNKYERRLIGKSKSKGKPKKGATTMEELRTIETAISSDHLKDQIAQFLDAINLLQPDEEVISIEGLPVGNIPLKIKFTKKLNQPKEEEVKENS